MNNFLKYVKDAALLVVLLFLAVFIGHSVSTVDALKQTAQATTATLQNANQSIDHERKRVDALVSELTLTTMEARKASTEERLYLGTLNLKLSHSIDQFDATMASAQRTLNATSDTVIAIQPVLTEAQKTVSDMQPVLGNLATATAGVSALVNDPNIPLVLAHVEKTSEHVDSTTASVDHVVKKFEDVYTHPVKWFKSTSFWTHMLNIATDAKLLF